MSAVATDTVVMRSLLPCEPWCEDHTRKLFAQLDVPRYSVGASVMPCLDSRAEWEAGHRTARKRAWKAERLGYTFGEVDYSQHEDDIYAINVSRPERQGRPMTAGYTSRAVRRPLRAEQTWCDHHRTHTYGVLSGRTLVAYLTLHRAGDLAMISMILGHGEHENDGIMYLLIAGTVEQQAGKGGWFYYNRHDSGTQGLTFTKERYGFQAADVEWQL